MEDKRKYKGDKSIKRKPQSFVIKIKENKTGANTEFLDVHRKVVMSKPEFIEANQRRKISRIRSKETSLRRISLFNERQIQFQ